MLIDRKLKPVLDLLIKSTPDRPMGAFSYDKICELSGMDQDEVFALTEKLISGGLAQYAYAVSREKRYAVGIALTYDGRKYKELGRLERIERWKERALGFISGVLATVLSSLILSWLLR